MDNHNNQRDNAVEQRSAPENGHSESSTGGLSSIFTRFSRWTAKTTGHPVTFFLAITVVIVWAISGPVFNFSDTWQLVINTGTTVVTFLMVFLIQSTQNRDTQAMQVKLDELLRAVKGAHNALINLEEGADQDLDEIKAQYEELARRAREKVNKGEADVGTPAVESVVSKIEEKTNRIEEKTEKLAKKSEELAQKNSELEKKTDTKQ